MVEVSVSIIVLNLMSLFCQFHFQICTIINILCTFLTCMDHCRDLKCYFLCWMLSCMWLMFWLIQQLVVDLLLNARCCNAKRRDSKFISMMIRNLNNRKQFCYIFIQNSKTVAWLIYYQLNGNSAFQHKQIGENVTIWHNWND